MATSELIAKQDRQKLVKPAQKHTESSVKVYFTKEYNRFSFINGNRNISDRKVKKIMKDIDEGLDVLKYCPIIVNEEMQIIDGQHRFHVAKTLKSWVWYIVTSEMSVREIAKINSNTDKWRNDDFMHCYVEQKNEHYIALNRFEKKYPFGLTDCIALLMTGKIATGGGHLESFRNGNFKVEHQERANKIVEEVLKFSFFKEHYTRQFIEAIIKLMDGDKCEMDVLLAKCTKEKEKLVKKHTYKEYLTLLEEIYNHRNSIRRPIY